MVDKQVTKEDVVTTQGATQSNSKSSMKVVLGLLALLIVGGLGWMLYGQSENSQLTEDSVTQVLDFDSVPEVVAKVNGVDIEKEDFVTAYGQASQMAVQQGLDVSDADLQTSISGQVLEVLVNAELLLQAAAAAGVSVSEEAVATEIEALTTQMGGSEALEVALSSSNMDMSDLEGDISEQLVIDDYLATLPVFADDVEVTDEEVLARYNEVAELNPDSLPPYEEVSEVIRLQLKAEIKDAAVTQVLEELKNKAEIELLYDPNKS